jgi:hypothetical protein
MLVEFYVDRIEQRIGAELLSQKGNPHAPPAPVKMNLPVFYGWIPVDIRIHHHCTQ